MSLLAETIVEEYFNYNGYFTIRGVKKGHDEIDLLAVRLANKNKIEAIHIEVQVSTKPVGYISKYTDTLAQELNIRHKLSARPRSEEVLKKCVDEWVRKKYTHPKKAALRKKLFPNQKWQFVFVHGNVRDKKELEFIREHSIDTIDIKSFIIYMADTHLKRFGTSSVGRDIINVFKLFKLES
ncbi:MAG: hypothetical protein POELPBGB_01864 [Bacteroidia bacterium]|nr:hypothetical protein [Bacteroidia bacterium]